MSWETRLKPAVYTSPAGKDYAFDYEELSGTISKKTSAWEFPDANGTYVQENGITGRRYPINAIFHGEKHDTLATEFENAILEAGIGRLSHPVYGFKQVVPFGEITRTTNPKESGSVTVISVTFYDTTGLVYPVSQGDAGSAIEEAIEEFNEALADDFAANLKIANATEKLTFREKFKAALDSVKNTMAEIAKAEKAVSDEVNDIYQSINGAVDILIATPATLAFQTAILLQAPARMKQSLDARVSGYKNLIDSLTTGDSNTQSGPGLNNNNANSFFNGDLYATAALSGYAGSAANWQFNTKSDAITMADDLLAMLDKITDWRDGNFDALGLIDTGGQYQSLQSLMAITAGYLVQVSFSLKTEKRITLDRSRTMIDLVAELYGEVDSVLDFFIDSNDLAGHEYLELPKGRVIRYFV